MSVPEEFKDDPTAMYRTSEDILQEYGEWSWGSLRVVSRDTPFGPTIQVYDVDGVLTETFNPGYFIVEHSPSHVEKFANELNRINQETLAQL